MIFIRLLSRIPWPIMLFLSSIMYWMVYKLIGYRKSVVTDNLRNSFPDKTEKELRKIRNGFYRSFFDFIFEILRTIEMSASEMRSRVTFSNPEVFLATPPSQAIIVLGTHFFNWELLGIAISEFFNRQLVYGYQKLSNPFSDQLMKKTRGKFGGIGVLRHETAKSVIKGRNENNWFYILADQAPVGQAQRYWTSFLHQPTSFYHGTGKVAKLANAPTLIMLPKKKKRGYYELRFEWIAKVPDQLTGEEILERYIRILEREIQDQPTEWLWTHKRWKNKPREEDIVSATITLPKEAEEQ